MRPDAVVVGKAMGNGFPLSGVIATPQLIQAFETGPLYFNTFAGGNVACATGLAVLQALERRALQANAHAVGAKLLAALHALQLRFPDDIGHVRGRGFFLGVEMVRSRASQAAAPGKAKWLQESMKRAQVCHPAWRSCVRSLDKLCSSWDRMRCSLLVRDAALAATAL